MTMTTMTMKRATRCARHALLGALLLVAPSTVYAKDLCIQNNIYSGPIVGKAFSLPGKGKCKPFIGTVGGGSLTGTACTNTAGTITHFTIVDSALEALSLDIILPLPVSSPNYFARFCAADIGSGSSCNVLGITISVDYCAATVTIP